jgi:hypothetical protein
VFDEDEFGDAMTVRELGSGTVHCRPQWHARACRRERHGAFQSDRRAGWCRAHASRAIDCLGGIAAGDPPLEVRLRDHPSICGEPHLNTGGGFPNSLPEQEHTPGVIGASSRALMGNTEHSNHSNVTAAPKGAQEKPATLGLECARGCFPC